MFLYRPEYYGITTTAEGQSTAGMAEVIIGKQRNGPVGSKMLYFVRDYARFENLSINDGQGDFIGASIEENRLTTPGDFSEAAPSDAMLPNSPMPPDDQAPF